MRRCHAILLLFWFVAPLMGQLQPLMDQHQMDGLAINPAYAGSQDALSLTTSSRLQWIGFEGAPKTLALAAHTPLRNKRVNLGIVLLRDQIGSRNETGALINYAYRIHLGQGKLSMGLGMGVSYIARDPDLVRFTDPDDLIFANGVFRATIPEFSLGGYYHTDRFFVGLSMPLFITQFTNEETGRYKPVFNLASSNYVLSTGYVFELNSSLDLFTSFLLRSNPSSITQAEIHTRIILLEKFWLGTALRTNGSLTGLMQFQANSQLRIGYGYSYELSPLSSYQQGTHELILRYTFRYIIDVISPRYF